MGALNAQDTIRPSCVAIFSPDFGTFGITWFGAYLVGIGTFGGLIVLSVSVSAVPVEDWEGSRPRGGGAVGSISGGALRRGGRLAFRATCQGVVTSIPAVL